MKLAVDFAGVPLKNPIATASGTCGFGIEYLPYYKPSELGAITLKALSAKPKAGNAVVRIAETPAGMLNSIGLQNPGVDVFLNEKLSFVKTLGTKIIANIAGESMEDYEIVAEKLNVEGIDLIELNISCPNVAEGGLAFGTQPKTVEEITARIKKKTQKPLIVKLSPNVTDIKEIALAAEAGGADALSLINTLIGMRIDAHTRRPVLSRGIGGLSGPAIKPVALAMVSAVARTTKLPLLGMGGIMTGTDAAEFIIAGATAVAIGTAAFADPKAPVRILAELSEFMEKEGVRDVNELRGTLKFN